MMRDATTLDDARRRGRSRRRLLDGEPADVDVKVAQVKNVHASEGDGAVSDLLQIELGGEGTTVKVDNLAEPVVFDIPFDYDPALEVGYDPGTGTGLGLAIVDKISAHYRITIAIERKYYSGSALVVDAVAHCDARTSAVPTSAASPSTHIQPKSFGRLAHHFDALLKARLQGALASVGDLRPICRDTLGGLLRLG